MPPPEGAQRVAVPVVHTPGSPSRGTAGRRSKVPIVTHFAIASFLVVPCRCIASSDAAERHGAKFPIHSAIGAVTHAPCRKPMAEFISSLLLIPAPSDSASVTSGTDVTGSRYRTRISRTNGFG